ncbi:ABC transporter permease [Actinomadura flavalba]|uniref:ABC transporter permease n=1 Tax=Actinomadura flavalba TaxID=1120938 RepID=UPI0003777C17|nr:ABC transporter permease [Actinomadura flavalba]
MLRTTLAGLLAHKVRLLLSTLAITLGVGFIVGTFVLTDSVDRGVAVTFAKSADKVDAAVLPREADEPVTPQTLDAIRRVPGVTAVHGMVKGDAPLLGRDGRAVGDFPTVGLSVPQGPLLRYDVRRGRVPHGPSDVVLDQRTASRHGFAVGDTVTVLDPADRPHRFTVTGLIDVGIDPDANFQGAVGFDPATARRMTGAKGFTEVDVLGADAAALTTAAGAANRVLSGDALAAELTRENGADADVIRTGLLLFAFVAMLVSALVIYNTFSILITQRMREMALLRCVGATRRQVFRGVLAEAVVVGLVGSLLGLAAGALLGLGALAAINAAGAGLPSAGVVLTPLTIALALFVGIVVTVGAAVLPARAATRVAPVAALRAEQEPGGGRFRPGPLRLGVTALFGVGGLAITVFAAGFLEKGQVALFSVALGGTVLFLGVLALMPVLVGPLGRVAGAVPARFGGVPGRLAVANARRSPRRTATTTIALTVGVGLMSLFAVIAASSKEQTDRRLADQFPVDFQVSAQLGRDSDTARVPHALATALRARPELDAVTEHRWHETRIAGEERTVTAVTPSAWGTVVRPEFRAGSLAAFRSGTAIVDEETAKSLNLRTGSEIALRGKKGAETKVKVAGVFGGDTPLSGVVVPEPDFLGYFGPQDPSRIYAKVAEGADEDTARAVMEKELRPYPSVILGSSAEMKAELNKAIDMILMVFAGLLGLAILIALFGIANTLTLSVVERTRESALLRALGLTKRQLRRMLSLEALIMAVIGAATGVVLGIAFAWAATRAMTEEAAFAVPYAQIALFIALSAVAGTAASFLPSRRATKASIVESLTHD